MSPLIPALSARPAGRTMRAAAARCRSQPGFGVSATLQGHVDVIADSPSTCRIPQAVHIARMSDTHGLCTCSSPSTASQRKPPVKGSRCPETPSAQIMWTRCIHSHADVYTTHRAQIRTISVHKAVGLFVYASSHLPMQLFITMYM